MNESTPQHFSSEDLLKRIQGKEVEPSINQIKRILSGMHPSEVAHSIESLPPKERKFLWSLIDTHVSRGLNFNFENSLEELIAKSWKITSFIVSSF